MRWFRKSAEDNAPRLISLSPLRQMDVAAADAEVQAVVGWAYAPGYSRIADPETASVMTEERPTPNHRRSRSALAEHTAVDRSSFAASSSSSMSVHQHLPCTLKRKPAVRRRSGGKGKKRPVTSLSSATNRNEKYT